MPSQMFTRMRQPLAWSMLAGWAAQAALPLDGLFNKGCLPCLMLASAGSANKNNFKHNM